MTDPNDRVTANYCKSYIDVLIPHIQQLFTIREQGGQYTLQRPNILTYQRTYRWLYNLLTPLDKTLINRDGRVVFTFHVPIKSIQHCIQWNLFFHRVLFDALKSQTILCRILHLQNRIVSFSNPNKSWNYLLIRNNRPNTPQENVLVNTEIWRESTRQLHNIQIVIDGLRQNQIVDPTNIFGSGRIVDYIQDVQNQLDQQNEEYYFTTQIGIRIKSNTNHFVVPDFINNRISNLNLPTIPDPQQQQDDDNNNNNDDEDPPQRNRFWMLVSRPEREHIILQRRRNIRRNINSRRRQLQRRRTGNILRRVRNTLSRADYNFLRTQLSA